MLASDEDVDADCKNGGGYHFATDIAKFMDVCTLWHGNMRAIAINLVARQEAPLPYTAGSHWTAVYGKGSGLALTACPYILTLDCAQYKIVLASHHIGL